MDQSVMSGQQSPPTAYDYRMYDRIWQRVSPDLVPYPEVRSAQPEEAETAAGGAAVPAAPRMEGGDGEGNLPGAEMNPCCMGSVAQESVAVLEGFIEEELAERRCCLALAGRVRSQCAARLLRRIASEKQAAARELGAAHYLITGACYTPSITVEHTQWSCLSQALRSCYHQEACNGFNYQRSADGTTDPCLAKLLNRLGEQAYRRAEDVMDLLSKVLC